jgi:hypothetical protein
MIRKLAESGLIVEVDPRLEVVTRRLRPIGQLAAEVTRNLFGEGGTGMLDGHDV